jgi:hypothetical protein
MQNVSEPAFQPLNKSMEVFAEQYAPNQHIWSLIANQCRNYRGGVYPLRFSKNYKKFLYKGGGIAFSEHYRYSTTTNNPAANLKNHVNELQLFFRLQKRFFYVHVKPVSLPILRFFLVLFLFEFPDF